MSVFQTLVLASGSPRRVALLEQAGITADRLVPTHIDETPARAEHPRSLARRLGRDKAERARDILEIERQEAAARASAGEGAETGDESAADGDRQPPYILAADTVVAVGTTILPKAELLDEASQCLRMLSGRAHRVYTGLALITPTGKIRQRVVETRVRFKRLTREEMESYLASGQWRGKAGGYAIQGLAGSFVIKLVGSYTNVVGLPLAETVNLLTGESYNVHFSWIAGGA